MSGLYGFLLRDILIYGNNIIVLIIEVCEKSIGPWLWGLYFRRIIIWVNISPGRQLSPCLINLVAVTLLNMIFCYIPWYHIQIVKNTSCTFSSDIYVSTIFLHAVHIVGTFQIKIDTFGGRTI